MLIWEMPSKNIFAYSTFIMGTLKGSAGRIFNFSTQSQNFAVATNGYARFALIFPYNRKSMSTKRGDLHLI